MVINFLTRQREKQLLNYMKRKKNYHTRLTSSLQREPEETLNELTNRELLVVVPQLVEQTKHLIKVIVPHLISNKKFHQTLIKLCIQNPDTCQIVFQTILDYITPHNAYLIMSFILQITPHIGTPKLLLEVLCVVMKVLDSQEY